MILNILILYQFQEKLAMFFYNQLMWRQVKTALVKQQKYGIRVIKFDSE